MERRAIKNADLATAAAANGDEPATLAQVNAEVEARLAAGPELTLPEKFEWFEKKLKAALTDGSVTASELGKIARETENAIAAAEQEAIAVRERGLDLLRSPDAQTARTAMENAQFFVGRLQTQRPRLEALLHARLLAEQRDAYLARYADLKREGEALGTELADLYPGMVGPLVEVFVRLRAFQQQCRALHLTDPGGLPHLVDPELQARRLHGFTRDTPSLLESVHLTDWQSGKEIWPPRQPSFAAEFAQSMTVPSVGAAWSDPAIQERQRAERVAEQERMARHYAAQSAEAEARENRQLREDWNKSQRHE